MVIALFFTYTLSCIVDADHTDTAIHFRRYPTNEVIIPLKPDERLAD